MSGLLIVVSGPSGAGKTSVLARLTAELPLCKFSVSMTTRNRREHEIEGKHYFFVPEELFLATRDNDGFLEHARVHGGFYGTPRAWVSRELDNGFDIILDIDVQGAAQVRRSHPEAVFIFLAPPSLEELRRRLDKRGSETPTSLEVRLNDAREEMANAHQYEYLVVNRDGIDGLSEATTHLKAILVAEKCRTHRMSPLILDSIVTTK